MSCKYSQQLQEVEIINYILQMRKLGTEQTKTLF